MHRPWFGNALVVPIAMILAIGATTSLAALEAKKETAPRSAKPVGPAPADAIAAPAPAEGKAATDVQQFCLNNAAAAGDARVAWQASKLQELDAQVKQRIAELEAKKAEYVEWLQKRDEAMKKANDAVVAIYSKMRPEAAALQFAAMEDSMASALLAKLNTRVASSILNEMEPGRAARLTSAIAGPPPPPSSDRKKS